MSRSRDRKVLLAPDFVARAATAMTDDPTAQWMLHRPRSVRRSFVLEVLDRGDTGRDRNIWMLRQDDDTRNSYLEEIVRRDPDARPETEWMLSQPASVRESYVRDVLGG